MAEQGSESAAFDPARVAEGALNRDRIGVAVGGAEHNGSALAS